MPTVLDPFRFILVAVSGWMNQRQLHLIDCLREENRVLREQLGGRGMHLNDDPRRRLAAKAKGLGPFTNGSTLTVNLPKEYLSQLPILELDLSVPAQQKEHGKIVQSVEEVLHKAQGLGAVRAVRAQAGLPNAAVA